ncbi:hypothetical protein [Haloactinomyces albus]|uniref:Uncharacterized protein n=1 Tax=Haloactinomyces albus TaxID=1352928 RepID=A0AAE3ZGA9_9ACTN|nr:hypothetical protein [Haloactinomyces albus]MDR7303019.1 hypothetical protein [Haloactinomyces albus]
MSAFGLNYGALDFIITRFADRGTHHEATSSSTKPDLIVRMLETLDVHDGHTALASPMSGTTPLW